MVGKEEEGGLRSRDAREDSRIHLVLIRQSGKQMSAVSEGGCGGRRDGAWIYLGGYTVWQALSAPRLRFSSHHGTLSPFLPSQADFSNSLLPEERKKEKRRQQRRECSPLSSFLSLSVIPSILPNPSLGAIFHHGLACVYYPLQNTSH